MAMATESFSIREYTERMRSIDFRRCWPFDDGSEARPLLPSILVRRFKWWGEELESARSKATVEEVKDTAISEGDETPLRLRTAMGRSAAAPATCEEGRRTANKGKQRTPKKRSIVELFAAAPLIAGDVCADEANSDEGESWEEEDAIEEEEEEEEMRRKKTMKESIIKKKKRGRKKKNNGIKDGLKVEICGWEKEKICKPKMISSVQGYMFRNAVCNRKSRKTARSFVETQKQPAKEKAVRKKHKALRTSLLLSRNQDVPKKVPVRSILKNQKRSTTDRKSSKLVGANAADLIKFYCKSNRHVTFSVKDDDILRNSKASSSMNFPQLQNLCKIFSDVLAASSAMNHSGKDHDLPDANDRPQEVNACEKGTHSSIISTIQASSADKNQSTDSIVNLSQPTVVNSSNSSCSGTEKASFAVMVDLNCAVDADDIDCGIPATSTLSTSCVYSGDPNSRVTSLEKNPSSTSDIHLEARLSMFPETSLVPPSNGKFVSSSDKGSSVTLHKNPSSHGSASCLIVYNNTNERQQPQVDTDANFCCQIKDHPSGGFQSPKGILGNMCYSMGSKKLGESLLTPNSASTNRSKCAGKDFIGLPLNSQGELIQFHSGTKFSEAYNKQNMEWSSIQGFSANRHVESSNGRMNHLEIMRKKISGAASYQKNQSNWNQKQCYSTRERVRHWLKFAELEDSERRESQKNESVKGKDIFLQCNSNPRSHSFLDYRNGDAIHDFCDKVDLQGKCNHYHSQPAIQPTMRLMGKNVVFGEMNKEYNGFNEGRPWNHNEHLSQQWMQRECVSHPTIGRSKGNPLEMLHSTPNFYHMKASEPTFDSTNINRLPQWSSRSTDLAMVDHAFKLDMNKQGLHPDTFMTKANQFFGNHMPAEGSISTGHRHPTVIASNPQNFHQHMLLSPSLCKHNQRVSTSQSQFKHQNFGNFPQPPLLQQPVTNLPQWLLHAKHQKRTQLSDPHYSDPNVANQPSTLSGTNSNFHLSSYHLPMIPLSSHGGDANPRKACRPFASNAFSPTIIPHAPPPKSSGDANKRSISAKKKGKDGENSKIASFDNPAEAHKLPKRPADFDDGMVSSAKKPLKGQFSSNISEAVVGINQINEHLDQAISMEFQPTENENGSCKSINSSNSLKFGGELRSGPTKLIAGAKHILKPCQREDEENCRLIHSTIMLHNTDASSKSFGPDKNISNIYNF